jgi:hypothetical protein
VTEKEAAQSRATGDFAELDGRPLNTENSYALKVFLPRLSFSPSCKVLCYYIHKSSAAATADFTRGPPSAHYKHSWEFSY